MRVFLVTHSYYEMDRREKLRILAANFDIELTLLIPRVWKHSLRELLFIPRDDEPYRTFAKKALLAGRNNLYFYPFLPYYILSRRPQIVHCEEEPFSFTTCLSILLGKLVGARTIFFTWQNLHITLPFPYNLFDRISMRLADTAIVGNADGRQILQEKGFSKPIFAIPQLGISKNFKKENHCLSLRNRLPCKGLVVGYIGRITRLKGIATLLKAVSMMEEETTALIIGRGEDLQSFRDLAAKLEIEDRLIFIDTVPHEEIARYIEALDVLILPSLTGKNWKEQFGQVLIEAMACGTPVVGSDSGAISAVIGDAGLIFKEGDAWDLAVKLKTLMKAEIRDELRQRGLKRVIRYFTHKKVAAATYEVYRFLLKGEPMEGTLNGTMLLNPHVKPHTILYLNTGADIGGAERSLIDFLKGLDLSRFKPIVVCPDDGPLTHILKEKGIGVYHCGFAGLGSPMRFSSDLLNLKRFASKNYAALVHGNSTLSAKHAMILGKILGIHSVVHVRDEIPSAAFFYRLWLRHSDRVIAISEAVRKTLKDAVASATVERIYNGIDTDRFHPSLNRFNALREWQWPEKTPVVGMVGRFSFEKGITTFLEAVARVGDNLPEARFILVGDVVFSKNRRFKEAAMKTAERLLLMDRIKFVGEREDVEMLIAGMDVLVVPSTLEAFGRIAAEAGACGKPVVATSIGGLPEIVADGETGILIPPKDPVAMSSGILKLLKDEGLRVRMGKNARKRICELFDIRKTTTLIENLYYSLLKETISCKRINGV